MTLTDVQQAAFRLRGRAVRTPLLRCPALDDATGGRVFLKAESLQRTGSFKFRGAYNRLLVVRDEGCRCVVAGSSGNHAAAVACAGRLLGMEVTAFMPLDAPPGKVSSVLAYGARVVRYDRYREDRAALVAAFGEATAAAVVPSADDRHVIAGQGTALLESLDELSVVDDVLAPVGGGGMLAGCAAVLRTRAPCTRLIGVEPEGSDDFSRSVLSGHREQVEVAATIADGLQLSTVAPLAWEVLAPMSPTGAVVGDEDIVTAMRFLAEHGKLLVEPSGAVGVAALLAGIVEVRRRTAVVVLTGGNGGLDHLVRVLAQSAATTS